MNRLWVWIILIALVAVAFKNGFVSINSQTEAKPTPVTSSTPKPTVTPLPSPTPVNLNSEKVWDLVQEWRKSEGRSEYTRDERLCKIAEDRTHDPDDNHKTFVEKYSDYPSPIQENAIYYANSEEQAFNSWLNSSPHLATLKKPWEYSCIKCSGTTCIQIFSNL